MRLTQQIVLLVTKNVAGILEIQVNAVAKIITVNGHRAEQN